MKVALCAVIKNEGEILAEWIAFHLRIGFDTIILMDNSSTDNTNLIIEKFSLLFDVRKLPWTEQGKGKQGVGYTKIVRSYREEFDWIAFIDADEFIVPTTNSSIKDLLDIRTGCDAIAIPWLMFGSSKHEEKPSGLVLENFTYRAPFSFPPNRHVKSIVRPNLVVEGLNPHYFDMRGDYYLPDNAKVEWQQCGILASQPSYDGWRLHHYFTRSKSHWIDRLSRGQLGQTIRTLEDFEVYDRNDIYDDTALPFIPSINSICQEVGLGCKEFWSDLISKDNSSMEERPVFSSSLYWNNRYLANGSSGSGSFGRLANFKADFLNRFVEANSVRDVIELGSGNGTQTKLFNFPEYTGIDVSTKAIQDSKFAFSDSSKHSFFHWSDVDAIKECELSISLDVIYHLVEDDIFEDYMQRLFLSSTKFVIIYSSNMDQSWNAEHVRHREFTKFVENILPEWRRICHVMNPYKFDPANPGSTSFSDFYVFSRTKDPCSIIIPPDTQHNSE